VVSPPTSAMPASSAVVQARGQCAARKGSSTRRQRQAPA
jgi:hypothetical protein